ncbi:Predicted O-methyltransferase YrrM [Marivirga sericea]|uniref:Predicted O-methyltransferase YrrM n=1 Tax=Marivirga sericea TaxID=1028 RepID=A0A1X7JZK3_9BACT|nr:O-methyltransferase [Marivirga sericea]SMG33650.1 Predicted O-methyltransferase YrrM [Marivirga sericea]
MEFLDPDLEKYIDAHTEPENELLYNINRETHTEVLKPRMLSGHLQGRVLSMLSHMIQPENILEIGTYTGYSALCMAEGLRENGHLITLDVNEELAERVQGYFKSSEFSSRIEMKIGKALEIIPTLDKNWDMVFIDADKSNYLNYYKLCIKQVRSGGYILVDNVLWSGKVLEKNRKKLDKDTASMLEFNEFVHHDDRVQNVLFPIRDGLMILRKK